MVVGVTGGSGFIGQHVVKELISKGFEVHSMGISKKNDIYLNLADFSSILKGLEKCKPEYLVHLASPSVQELYRSNRNLSLIKENEVISAEINGSHTLFKTAKNLGVKKIIYISSAAVYGENNNNIPFNEQMVARPHTLYGSIKLCVEKIGEAIFPDFISLRLFAVYGKSDYSNRLVPTVLNAKANDHLELTPCQQITDFIYVKDVANCISTILKSDLSKGTFNLGSGFPIKLKDAVKSIIEYSCKSITLHYGAKEYSGSEVMFSYADMTLLNNLIVWSPNYSFTKGLNDYCNEVSIDT